MTRQIASRRTALMDATVSVILRSGIRRTSIEQIAHVARISKGAVYLEFPNKKALLEAVVRREYRDYLDDALALVTADPDGGRLSGIYRHSIAALVNRPFMMALYTDHGQILAGLLKGPDHYRPRMLLGADFLAELADAELVRADIDPAVVSHLLGTLSLGPLLAEPLLRGSGAPPIDATFRLLADLVVPGLEPSTGGDPQRGADAFRKLVEGMRRFLDPDPVVPGSPC
ncbi:AcrR family transcriptional regulator [Brevibacterium pityocampae]